MEIRRSGEAGRTPQPQHQAPAPGGAKPDKQAGSGDGFTRQPEPSGETPFWLVRMSADRMAGRRYLDRKACRKAQVLEAAWIRSLVAETDTRDFVLPPLKGAEGLAAFQGLVNRLVQAAGFVKPQVVWLPGMREYRGQYVFRVEGGLIQLQPQAAGDRAAWVETVAHETFHHFQQELVTALYKGEAFETAELALLAAYYRDARAVYKTLPPAAHRQQELEVGAWTYGAAISRQAKG
jgi:hypothetical protein